VAAAVPAVCAVGRVCCCFCFGRGGGRGGGFGAGGGGGVSENIIIARPPSPWGLSGEPARQSALRGSRRTRRVVHR